MGTSLFSKHSIVSVLLCIAMAVGLNAQQASFPDASACPTINVDAGALRMPISPMLYGIFFEEINRASDGGLYAEMIQNRSLEDADVPVAWMRIQGDGVEGKITLDKEHASNRNIRQACTLRLPRLMVVASVSQMKASRAHRNSLSEHQANGCRVLSRLRVVQRPD